MEPLKFNVMFQLEFQDPLFLFLSDGNFLTCCTSQLTLEYKVLGDYFFTFCLA